ncbi:MAG: aldehyde-activating protein [Gammaproteobacteria bacterium]|nr:aldehyde-activating protein [Gammaproteobacteria bacterium]
MLNIECHCGNVKLTANRRPSSITSCNCSICYRLGALWAYFVSDDVELRIGEHPSAGYAWGEKSITYHRCGNCGCTTHYTSSDRDDGQRIALNCRMAPISEIEGIPVRSFDGRDSWRYLDR